MTYDEVLRLTGQPPRGRAEDYFSSFVPRLIKAIRDMPLASWNRLPAELQVWYDVHVTLTGPDAGPTV